jgi:phosphoribosylformylglycinamidine (FGAM) synthase PurS component
MWVVGVGYREGQKDPLGENTKSDILDLGFSGVSEVKTLQTYVIEGGVGKKEVESIGKELLADNVVQFFNFDRLGKDGEHVGNLVNKRKAWAIEVFFRRGVMDAVGLSVERALEVLGVQNAKARTGTIYVISGDLEESEIKTICEKCLANGLIQTYRYRRL